MDAMTAFVLVTVMCLLNGAVLGFMHNDLPEQLRPSARTWRRGTLIIASGAVVLGVQAWLPAWLALPLGNALLILGLNSYWQALLQFDGLPTVRWLWAMPLAVAVVTWWFTAMYPSLVVRVALTSVAWLTGCAGCAWTLRRGSPGDTSRSRRVLIGVLSLLAGVMIFRAVYFVFGRAREQTIIEPGSWVNALTPMFAAALPVLGTTAFLLMCSDRLRQQWERAALTDHLTGLSNRRTISDLGIERVAQAKRLGLNLSVAVIDLDHFKQVNDQFGHSVGDLALQHIAATLRSTCRRDDLVSRHGGEEFVVIFDRLDLDGATLAAERLRVAIAQAPLPHASGTLQLTASLGVAALDPADQSIDDLVRRADRALYRAKEGGRNRVEAQRGPAVATGS